MVCKHCQAQLPKDAKFCLHCGMPCEEETPAVQEETVVIAADEVPELHEDISVEEVVASSGDIKKKKSRIMGMCACIVGLAVLAVVLFFGIKGEFDLFSWLKPRENTIHYKDSYSVSDKKAEAQGDKVVATMGDIQLTNRQLQMYYWMQVYDFLDYYGAYAAYFGLDVSAPLDEQEIEEGKTWQQYFLETALQNWQTYTALSLEAKANNHVMSEEYSQLLDGLEEKMQAAATKDGFASIDEMIMDEMGAGTSFQEYFDYLRTYYEGYSYFDQCYTDFAPTDAEIEAYFAEKEEQFKESSITKESGKYVDVRHILIKVAEPKKDGDSANAQTEGEEEKKEDDGNYGFSQEAWDICLAKAEEILNNWLAGEMTEDSFAALAKKHSEDPGSKDNGGLYTGVEEGQMVETFNDWIFDEVRIVGDYGLVKTKHGYHIMYFSGSEEIWHAEAKNALISDRTQKMVEEAVKNHPVEVNYKQIVLAVVEMK